MLVFPQLTTGATAVYPVTRHSLLRSVVNELGDGRTDVLEDPEATQAAWELRAAGLTLAEWTAIEGLFEQVWGRWGTFTFLDPTGNLLARSEEFGSSLWAKGPLIGLTPGVADPWGTTRATQATNAGLTGAVIAQTLEVPGTFKYCLSVWARSGAGSRLTLQAGALAESFVLSSEWRRIAVAGNAGLTGASAVTFAAQLDAGGSVQLFGMQVEGQSAPSDYKQTGARGGVFAKARFDTDQLTATAQGTDVFDSTIRIVSAAT